MKESKFIELLNLYIDQQISPDDAAALEQEILHDGRRRRTYHEYCQMHRACSLVFENFRSQAEPEHGGAVARAGGARRARWGYYAAGLAAAASLAFVALQVFVQPAATPARGTVAAGATLASPAPIHVEANIPAGYGRQTTDFVAQRLVLFSPTMQPNSASFVIVADRDLLRPLANAKAAPRSQRPSIEQFVFEPPAGANDNPPALRIRQNTDGQEEMTAYQFQR